MPKIIENLGERLKEETRKQIEEKTYSEVTIRSVAKACGIAIGTVYNYFPSKDALVASYLLDDWKQCISVIHDTAKNNQTAEFVCKCIHEQLLSFIQKHIVLFQDKSAISDYQKNFQQYHLLLRSQLAEPLKTVCPDAFTAEFAAESLLTWTISGKTFPEIWNVLKRTFL